MLYLDYDASRYSTDEMKKFATTLDEILLLMKNPEITISNKKIFPVENALDVEINTEDTGKYLLYLDYDASRYSTDEMQNPETHTSEILK